MASPFDRLADPVTLPERPSIAVLVFLDVSGEIPAEGLANTLTTEILATLSRVSDVFVRGRDDRRPPSRLAPGVLASTRSTCASPRAPAATPRSPGCGITACTVG